MTKINSRSKGIRGERQVIDALQPVVDECFRLFKKQAPILQRNTLQSDRGGSDIAGLEFLAIEVKNAATLNVGHWWIQCEEQARASHKEQIPILIYKASRGHFRVRMHGYVASEKQKLDCVVDISFEDFKRWLEHAVFEHLAQCLGWKPLNPDERRRMDAIREAEKSKPPMGSGLTVFGGISEQAAKNAAIVAEQRRVAALPKTTEEKTLAAIVWCKKVGYKVPPRRSDDFQKMVEYWFEKAVRGEA